MLEKKYINKKAILHNNSNLATCQLYNFNTTYNSKWLPVNKLISCVFNLLVWCTNVSDYDSCILS